MRAWAPLSIPKHRNFQSSILPCLPLFDRASKSVVRGLMTKAFPLSLSPLAKMNPTQPRKYTAVLQRSILMAHGKQALTHTTPTTKNITMAGNFPTAHTKCRLLLETRPDIHREHHHVHSTSTIRRLCLSLPSPQRLAETHQKHTGVLFNLKAHSPNPVLLESQH